MFGNTKDLMEMVESLPIELKVKLVERILSSLQPIKEDIDALWAEEAEKRIQEIEENKVELIEETKIFEEITKVIS